ncbi:hypothetical protein SEVIR_7G107900v4 [Setaria viridis]|uniref:Uncharacterized protein n=1 Tax=Setaria viridis TaxID=4556 RepID=A0A4U6TNQ8_SETVI|nr:hypothetical protein SEVIR_7G107900v2 [Setaria viridis]
MLMLGKRRASKPMCPLLSGRVSMHTNSSFSSSIESYKPHIIARRFLQPSRKSRLSTGTFTTIVVKSSTLIAHPERSSSTNKFSNCVQPCRDILEVLTSLLSASIGGFCSEDSRGSLKDGIQWVTRPYPSKLNDLREEGSPSGTTTFSSPSQPSRKSIWRFFAIDKLAGLNIRSF